MRTLSGFQFRRDSDRLAIILGELLPRNQAVCAQGRYVGHAEGKARPAKVNGCSVFGIIPYDCNVVILMQVTQHTKVIFLDDI